MCAPLFKLRKLYPTMVYLDVVFLFVFFTQCF